MPIHNGFPSATFDYLRVYRNYHKFICTFACTLNGYSIPCSHIFPQFLPLYCTQLWNQMVMGYNGTRIPVVVDMLWHQAQSWRARPGRGHTWESWVADTAVLCCFVFQSLALPKHSMPPDRRHVACETMRHADGGFSVIASYSFSSSGRDLFFRSLAPDGSSMLAFGLSGFMFTHPAISTINQLGCGASHSTLV